MLSISFISDCASEFTSVFECVCVDKYLCRRPVVKWTCQILTNTHFLFGVAAGASCKLELAAGCGRLHERASSVAVVVMMCILCQTKLQFIYMQHPHTEHTALATCGTVACSYNWFVCKSVGNKSNAAAKVQNYFLFLRFRWVRGERVRETERGRVTER